MYKDRIPSPHQLSYSAVNSYQSTGLSSVEFLKHRVDDPTDKYGSSLKQPTKQDNNSDLAFLRNTVGPTAISNQNLLGVQNESKKLDASLRQTMNVTSNVKDYIKIQSPIT